MLRLFRVRDASERVARGFAIGLVVNFFPTFGFGVLISGFLARLCGGSAVAGLVGGALLTFAWPLLFFLNIRVGSLFVRSPVVVDELADVTEKTMSILTWGGAFTVGAILNCLLVGLLSYLLMQVVHRQLRPAIMERFRRLARDHQRRHRRPRADSSTG